MRREAQWASLFYIILYKAGHPKSQLIRLTLKVIIMIIRILLEVIGLITVVA